MDRRAFFRCTGLVTGGAVLGASGIGGAGEYRQHEDASLAGHAVGCDRPPDMRATTVAYRGPAAEPAVALTFDDGPSQRYTARLLDILDANDVTATFFVLGRHAASLPMLISRAARRHEIANHSWSHPNMSLGHAASVTRELQRTERTIRQLTGRAPTAFRPPFGCFSGATAMVAARLHYSIVLWDLKFNVEDSASSNATRLASQAVPGSIILAHDGGTLDNEVVVQALPMLIDSIRRRGMHFVTVSQMLGSTSERA